jgi:hypothetical protein
VVQDLRHAIRTLFRSRGFALVSASALAVGIGANVTFFGFVSSLLLRPMDAAEPERLVRVDSGGEGLMTFLSYGEYVHYRDRNQTLSRLSAFHPGGIAAVRANGPAEMISVTPVSGNYFEVLFLRGDESRDFDRMGGDNVGAACTQTSPHVKGFPDKFQEGSSCLPTFSRFTTS